MAGAKKSRASNGANCCLPNCATLRVRAGKNIADLAQQSNISRDSIRKIESGRRVTPPVANAIFNVLNDWHKGNLVRAKEIQDNA